MGECKEKKGHIASVEEGEEYCIGTQLVQVGNRSDTLTGTVSPPIFLSSAYRHEGIGQSTGYDYIRTGNPTRHLLERAIAALEKGDQGYACSSGMAAIQTVFGLFEEGDEILVSQDIYGGTYRLFEQLLKKYGLIFHYVEGQHPNDFAPYVNENTKAVFIESPTNPLMQTVDIKDFANFVNDKALLLIVDNTFYTPYIQQPLQDGADIVIHSATKYISGHNDVLAGLIVAKGEALCEELHNLHNAIGATLSPFDSWLVMRGIKTLAVRMQKHEQNAGALVSFLEEHPLVTDVLYPGRGGMISFRIIDEQLVNPLLQQLKLITFAESLGGVESFITYPATQTHMDIPEHIRTQYGVCNRLLRLSVGIEEADDLINDFRHVFAQLEKGWVQHGQI